MRNHFEYQKKYFARWFAGFYAGVEEARSYGFQRIFTDHFSDYEEPSSVAYMAAHTVLGYYVPGTKWYRNKQVLQDAYDAFSVYRSHIHEDGSVDLSETNFHDPSQAGFVSRHALSMIEIISCNTLHTPEEDKLYDLMLSILKLHGEAMLHDGFHTPNHRWVISSAMALLYRHTHDEKYMDYIKGFLKEGIDCDENGEYTERSAGHYNQVCNLSFIRMGIFLRDPSYFEYPRRNLHLMLSFIEPNNTMCTINSVRQDKKSTIPYDVYYSSYLFCALQYKDSEFAYMAEKMLDQYENDYARGGSPISLEALNHFLIYPETIENYADTEPKTPPADRSCFLPESGIARIYRPDKNMTITMVRRTPVFLQMMVGSHVVQFRFGGAFFGDPHSQFRAQQIEKTEKGYRLISDEAAGYRSQFDEVPESSDWHKMDHSKRHLLNIQHFKTTIDITVLPDGIALDIDAGGCEGILTKCEIGLEPGYRIDTADFATMAKAGDYFFLKGGRTLCTAPDWTTFIITGSYYKHSYAKSMRGTLPYNDADTNLVLTGITPHKNHVEIHVEGGTYTRERKQAAYEAYKQKQQ